MYHSNVTSSKFVCVYLRITWCEMHFLRMLGKCTNKFIIIYPASSCIITVVSVACISK